MFELAAGGTLFLDEIGELDLNMQVKLLRALDGSAYYRLGGTRRIKVDVRVVTATNADLTTAVETGTFRRDLFHRLEQVRIEVPPLRSRTGDVTALASYFLLLWKLRGCTLPSRRWRRSRTLRVARERQGAEKRGGARGVSGRG